MQSFSGTKAALLCGPIFAPPDNEGEDEAMPQANGGAAEGVPASELFPLISGFLTTLGMTKTVASLAAESKKWKEAVVRGK